MRLISVASATAAVLLAGCAAHPAAPAPAPASKVSPSADIPGAPPPPPATLTYVVTGSQAASVTYGPAGHFTAGSVPLHMRTPLRHPAYYLVSAQLGSKGTITCKILINKAVITESTASGSYKIALCEVSQDPRTGKWVGTTASG